MEAIQFDKKLLHFMEPPEGMVASQTLELANVGAVPTVFKAKVLSRKSHLKMVFGIKYQQFLVLPRKGRIEPGGVKKITILFKSGFTRLKSCLRIDFAPLSSFQSKDLEIEDFWNPKYSYRSNIRGINISRTTFKIEIVEFNAENRLFEPVLFTPAHNEVITISALSTKPIDKRLDCSAEFSGVSDFGSKVSVRGGIYEAFDGGGSEDGKQSERNSTTMGNPGSHRGRAWTLRSLRSLARRKGGNRYACFGNNGLSRHAKKPEAYPYVSHTSSYYVNRPGLSVPSDECSFKVDLIPYFHLMPSMRSSTAVISHLNMGSFASRKDGLIINSASSAGHTGSPSRPSSGECLLPIFEPYCQTLDGDVSRKV